jgi:hypothetical protein
MLLSASICTQIGVLVIATSIIQLANGFIGTIVSLRVAFENLMTSSPMQREPPFEILAPQAGPSRMIRSTPRTNPRSSMVQDELGFGF